MALNLYKIFRGTTADDGTGTPARTAAEGINNNMDLINNELTRIDSASEKSANKAINLDAPNDTNYPTTKAVSDSIGSIESNANTYTDTQLASYQVKSEKGQASGYAPLDAGGLVPTAHLPAYVEEIVEGTYVDSTTFNDTSGVAVTPGTNKIYVDTTTSKAYRWGGSVYTEIVASPGTTDEVVEGSTNLYFTGERVRNTLLTGLDAVVSAAIAAGDTIIAAFGKIQAQINGVKTDLGKKLDKGTYTGTAKDLETLANSKETPAGAQSKADAKVEDAIADGVIDKAPSQNAVFDALAGKEDGLGNPDVDGKILSSTAAGVRSWVVAPDGTAPKEHEINGVRITDSPLSTYAIDWDAGSLFQITLMDPVTFSDANLPTGTNTKVIEMIVTGDFALTLPTYWVGMPTNDEYVGTGRNHFVVTCINGNSGAEDVIYQLTNL